MVPLDVTCAAHVVSACLLVCVRVLAPCQVIERILLAYIDNVKAKVPLAVLYPGEQAGPSEVEPPSTLLWLLLVAAKVSVSACVFKRS